MEAFINFTNYRHLVENAPCVNEFFEEIHHFREYKNKIKAEANINIDMSARIAKIKLIVPIVPSFLFESLSLLLGISINDLYKIIHYLMGIKIQNNNYVFVPISEVIEAKKEDNIFVGSEAIEKLLDLYPLNELYYQIQKELFKDHNNLELQKRKDLVAYLIATHINLKDFLFQDIAILPSTRNTLLKEKENSFFYDINEIVYKLGRINKRYSYMKSKENVPMLVYLNEAKMLQEKADMIFDYFVNKNITFKDELFLVKTLINEMNLSVNLRIDGNDCYINLPLYFKYAEENLKIYIQEKEYGFELSDNGFIFDYFKYDLHLDLEKYNDLINKICEKFDFIYSNNKFIYKIAGFENSIVMKMNFSSFIEGLSVLANVYLFEELSK